MARWLVWGLVAGVCLAAIPVIVVNTLLAVVSRDLPVQWLYGVHDGVPVCQGGKMGGASFTRGLPPYVGAAFLSAEEPGFFQRPPLTLVGLVWDAAHGRTQSSPVADTLARCMLMAWGAPESMAGDWHVKRLAATLIVEDTLPKQAIFDSYLEAVVLGNGIRGIGAGAAAYFGKAAPELSVAEAAYLAAIARSPSRFVPDARAALARRELVLVRMLESGAITPAQYGQARSSQP